jgi:hypothetical protein
LTISATVVLGTPSNGEVDVAPKDASGAFIVGNVQYDTGSNSGIIVVSTDDTSGVFSVHTNGPNGNTVIKPSTAILYDYSGAAFTNTNGNAGNAPNITATVQGSPTITATTAVTTQSAPDGPTGSVTFVISANTLPSGLPTQIPNTLRLSDWQGNLLTTQAFWVSNGIHNEMPIVASDPNATAFTFNADCDGVSGAPYGMGATQYHFGHPLTLEENKDAGYGSGTPLNYAMFAVTADQGDTCTETWSDNNGKTASLIVTTTSDVAPTSKRRAVRSIH